MAGKRANGEGCLRQRKDGKWEVRVTTGRDPGTGKLIRKSFYFDTQKEARKKLNASAHEVDEGTFLDPSKMTISKWLDLWLADYTGNLKQYTLRNYESKIKNHIKPHIGAVRVSELSPAMVNKLYKRLLTEGKQSPKSVRNTHGILHSSMETLVELREIKTNPCTSCAKRLPKSEKKEMQTLTDDSLTKFMEVIKGNAYENVFLVDLFTGMRQGEILGLRWSCIDFKKGFITIDKQLYMPPKGGQYTLQPLKNNKERTICVAPFVMEVLKKERQKQLSARLRAGAEWNCGDLKDLVFTNDLGKHLSHKTVYKQFKKAVELSGVPGVRFHDMRHTFATLSIQQNNGGYKTVSESLGHATTAFTLDTYAHVTQQMQKASADKMETFIQSVK